MRGNPFSQAPPLLCVLAVLAFLGMLMSREASVTEALPVFLSPGQGFVQVELAGDDQAPGVYQFYDGLTPFDVIKLTGQVSAQFRPVDPAWSQPLCSGESLRIIKKDQKIASLQRGWMAASHRIALGIPLHPDRMSRKDWLALPGVGATLAEQIEMDRQNNGEFDSLDALARVKGVGQKRLDTWRVFF